MVLEQCQLFQFADYKLLLTFENNENRVFDVNPYLKIGKFSELKDTALFNSVSISFDSIEWANKLDLDPEFLYLKSEVVSFFERRSVLKVKKG